ncbi:MAG: hypothetical protein K8T10_12730 [Candidatus Eremiobacteraeota bacterium]|nr:hypothetical protein [Candidatus Eremiobacteraeota bacterium]
MSVENIGRVNNQPREVTLSELRENRGTAKKKEWTNENVQVVAEPKDEFMADSAREPRMKRDFKRSQTGKARHDLNKTLGDIVGISEDEKKGKLSSPFKAHLLKKTITAKEFLSSERAIVTDESSTVLSQGEIKEDFVSITELSSAPTSLVMDENGRFMETTAPKSRGEIESRMNLKKDDLDKKATIGTFNIEWLGVKKRSEEDYKNIAQVIKDSGASLLGIQEIARIDGLRRVMKYLPDFGYILGKSGQQMVGVLFDKDRVKYDVNSIEQLEDVTLGNPGLRPPISVDMKVDNFDFNFVVMHLKSGFDGDDLDKRERQAAIVNKWLKNHLETKVDKDVIVVGDYNDFIDSEALGIIDRGNTVHYATSEAKEKGIYSNVRYKNTIDHGALSEGKGGAIEEYVHGSLRTVDENDYHNYLRGISDHKPIVFDVRSGVDND